jgi:hypothetical protein
MAPFASYVSGDGQADRVLQLIVAGGPFVIVFMMRMVLGRSKEVVLAAWLSVGWFALRASMNPSISSLFRPIERLLQG